MINHPLTLYDFLCLVQKYCSPFILLSYHIMSYNNTRHFRKFHVYILILLWVAPFSPVLNKLLLFNFKRQFIIFNKRLKLKYNIHCSKFTCALFAKTIFFNIYLITYANELRVIQFARIMQSEDFVISFF